MCEIQWIGKDGKPTPDDNPPIGRVRCKVYGYERGFHNARLRWAGDWSRWFTICEEHAKTLSESDMVEWMYQPVENYEITFEWPNGDWTWIYESAPDFHDALALALDKCPATARVHSIVHMTAKQVAANLNAANKQNKQFAAN